MGLRQLTRRVAGREGALRVPFDLEPFLTVDVLLLGGGAAVLIDDLVPRGPRQERDQILLLVQVVRTRPDLVEEAPPYALKEVERIEPGPQQPRQLAADDQADLGLVAGQQLAGGF